MLSFITAKSFSVSIRYRLILFLFVLQQFHYLNVDFDAGTGASLASKLRSLSSESFVKLLSAIFMIVRVMHTTFCICFLKV